MALEFIAWTYDSANSHIIFPFKDYPFITLGLAREKIFLIRSST